MIFLILQNKCGPNSPFKLADPPCRGDRAPLIRVVLQPGVWTRYYHSYLLLLEKQTGSAASQGIPRIFGTRRFITVLTSARHLSLS